MRWLRRLAIITVASLLRLTLIFGVTLSVVLLVLATPKHLEHALIETHAYDQFVPAILQAADTPDTGKNTSDIPLSDAGVRKVIIAAFPPSVIKQSSDAVIEGTYNWLEGKAPRLQFHIDITANRDLAAKNIAAYAFNRLAAQPVCKTNPKEIDPFTATCIPLNFSVPQEEAAYATAVNNLLPKTVFTANDLPRLSSGKSLAHDFPQAPKIYHVITLLPLLFGGLLLSLTASLFLLSKTKRGAFRLLSSITLGSGIALVTTPILYELVYPRINGALHIQSTNTGVNATVANIVQNMSHGFYTMLIQAAIIVINLGLVMVGIERLTRSTRYDKLAERAGITNSGSNKKTAVNYSAASVPLQTSEGKHRPTTSKYVRTYRKLMGKEF